MDKSTRLEVGFQAFVESAVAAGIPREDVDTPAVRLAFGAGAMWGSAQIAAGLAAAERKHRSDQADKSEVN